MRKDTFLIIRSIIFYLMFLLTFLLALLSSSTVFSTSWNWNFSNEWEYNYNSSKINIQGGFAEFEGPSSWCNVAGGICNTNWTRRKKVVITGSTDGALTNYQLRVVVNYEASMQDDFDDIRFVACNQTTALSYYRESFTPSTSAVFWVQIPSIPASPTKTYIYMYYGNPAATTLSTNTIFPTATFDDTFATLSSINATDSWNLKVDTSAGEQNLKAKPRRTYYSELTATATTTSTTYQVRLSITLPANLANHQWLIIASASVQNSSTSYNTLVRLQNTTATVTYSEILFRPQVATDWQPFSAAKMVSLAANQTIEIQYCTSNAAGTARIKDARLIATEIPTANFQTAISEGASSTSSTTFVNKTSLTFTPATSGDYLIIADSDISANVTTHTNETRLTYNGADVTLARIRPNIANNYYKFFTIFITNLTATSHTFNIDYRRIEAGGGGNTALIRNSRIIAIRLDEFADYVTSNSPGESSTTQTSYQDKLTLNWTPTITSDYILFSLSLFRQEDTGQQTFTRINVNDAIFTEVNYRPQFADNYISFFVAQRLANLSGAQTARIQYRSTSTTNAFIKNAVLFAIPISARGRSVAIPQQTDRRFAIGSSLTFNHTEPLQTDIKYFIEYWTGSSWELVPNSILPGNSTGFDVSGVSLSSINQPSVYSRIRISCDIRRSIDTNQFHVATVNDWQITNYRYRVYTANEPTYIFQGEKTQAQITDDAIIYPKTDYGPEFAEITAFVETLGPEHQGNIQYQITNDRTHTNWYWWNGTAWASAPSESWAFSNTAAVINTNISTFHSQIGDGYFFFKAFLRIGTSCGKVQLDNIKVDYVTLTAPSIASLSPSSGTSGTSVTINGANFGTSQGTSKIYFSWTGTSGKDAGVAQTWSNTSIVVNAPADVTTGPVVVIVGGVMSNDDKIFTVLSPSITSLSPNTGYFNTQVTITGNNFGTSQGSSFVRFFNNKIAPIESWTNTQIICRVPIGAETGNVIVNTIGGGNSNGVAFTVTADDSTWNMTNSSDYEVVPSNSISFASSMAEFKPGWWNASWQKRKEIKIGGSTAGAQTNYAVRIEVSYDSDMQSDFRDIRFTNSAHTTELSHWQESFQLGASAIFWVLIPNIPASPSSVSIFMYYGNPSATSTSNPHTTFKFFSNADTLTGWTNTRLSGSGSFRVATCRTRSGSGAFAYNQNTGTDCQTGHCPGCHVNPTTCNTATGTCGATASPNFNFGGAASDTRLTSPVIDLSDDVAGKYYLFYYDKAKTENGGFISPPAAGDWDRLYIEVRDGGGTDRILCGNPDNPSDPAACTNGSYTGSWGIPTGDWAARYWRLNYNNNNARISFRFNTGDGLYNCCEGWYIEDIIIRKKVSPEPSVLSFEAEEDRDNVFGQTPYLVPIIGKGVPFLEILTFVHTYGPENAGSVRYQLSHNRNEWYYHNGTNWVLATGGFSTTNTAEEVNANCKTYENDVDSGTLYVKVYFAGTGGQKVQLDNIQVTVTSPPIPTISNLSPSSGYAYQEITINGSNFGTTTGSVYFAGVLSPLITFWSDTQIKAYSPVDVQTGGVIVRREGKYESNSVTFTVLAPSITSLSPNSGYFGTEIRINGNNFGNIKGSSYVRFSNNVVAQVSFWSNTRIDCYVPYYSVTGNVNVITTGGTSAGVNFTVTGDNATYPFTVAGDYTYPAGIIEVVGGMAELEPTNWWNASWTRRRRIDITGSSTGAGINYPVRISVPHNANMQANKNDIRFTLPDQTTELAYYREGREGSPVGTACDATANCVFWVKVPNIPQAPSITSIYMYYGNASAAYTGNPDDVFTFFENFEGCGGTDIPVNPAKWTVGGSGGTPNFWTITNVAGNDPSVTITNREGSCHVRSMNRTQASTEAWIEAQVTNQMSARVEFRWAVSSQANKDILEFRINGVQVATISGAQTTHTNQNFLLSPGVSTLKWSYGKDYTTDTGNDRGYFDYVIVRHFLSPEPVVNISTVEKVFGTFAGQDTRVIRSNTGIPYVEIVSFSGTETPRHTGEIRYQIGRNAGSSSCATATWYRYNPATEQWVVSAENWNEANTKEEIQSGISLFNDDLGTGWVCFRAFFRTGGVNFVQLDNVWIVTSSNASPNRPSPVNPGQNANMWDNNDVYITWVYSDAEGDPQQGADIQYSTDGGITWQDISPGNEVIGSQQFYNWNASSVPDGTTFRVRVRTYDTKWGAYARSSNNFSKDSTRPTSSTASTSPPDEVESLTFTVNATKGVDTGGITQSGMSDRYYIRYKEEGGMWQDLYPTGYDTGGSAFSTLFTASQNATRYYFQSQGVDRASWHSSDQGNKELEGIEEVSIIVNLKTTSAKYPTTPTGSFVPTGAYNMLNNTFCIGNTNGRYYCLNGNGGEQFVPYLTSSSIVASPSIRNGVSYFSNTGGMYYAVNSAGGLLWSRNFSGISTNISSSFIYPIGDTHKLFVMVGGRLYCLNLEDGSNCATWGGGVGFANIGSVMSTSAKPDVHYIFGGDMYVGTQDGLIRRVRMSDGTIMGSTPFSLTKISAPLLFTEDSVYVGGEDSKFYAIAVPSLGLRWAFNDGGTASKFTGGASINYYTGRIYVGNDNNKLYCLNAQTGAKIWEYIAQGAIKTTPLVYIPVSNENRTYIYFTASDGRFYCLRDDGASASLCPSYPYYTGGEITSSPVLFEGTNEDGTERKIIFGSNSGRVYYFNPEEY